MKPIIKVENLSKQYRLGNIGTGTLSNDLKRWWHGIRGKEDPFLKIGETNDRTAKGGSEYVWALKDINFEVMPGEILGIIGKNGAGKSTLLKILSKVTGPTTGRIDYNGRIGSLLEVGTGFHPELTGRENIFLNGAILGMTKAEIRSKLDEIIAFSGCERYIDTPVKRYSSGMTVRLGFAVAAHLEPEILVVDEVLAVGDDEFQKKAIGKMQDVSRNEGRTVLFVSHNLTSIKQLCTKGILVEKGRLKIEGAVNEVIDNYLHISKQSDVKDILSCVKKVNEDVEVHNVLINGSTAREHNLSGSKNSISIKIEGFLKKRMKMCLELYILDDEERIITLHVPDFTKSKIKEFEQGCFVIDELVQLPKMINSGKYYLCINLANPLKELYVSMHNAVILECSGFINKSGYVFSYKEAGFFLLD